jgi:hypothetical protein
MNFGLDFIKKLKPMIFRFKAPLNDGRDHFGFIAQDIDKVADGRNYGFLGYKKGYLTVNYEEFISPIVKAIQELSDKVEKLENKVDKLENPKKYTPLPRTTCPKKSGPIGPL